MSIMAQNQSIRQSTDKYLDQLIADKSLTSTELRTCLETIVGLYRNILQNSCEDQKYCRIRTSNPNFRSKVWQHFKARPVLLNNGWSLEYDTQNGERYQVIRFRDQSKEDINHFIKVLMEYKMDVRPVGNQSFKREEELDQTEEELRYQEMRRKGAEQRLQELQEFRRNEAERQTIATNVRNEIKSDNNYRELKNNCLNKCPKQ